MDILHLKCLAYFEKIGTKCPRERKRSRKMFEDIKFQSFHAKNSDATRKVFDLSQLQRDCPTYRQLSKNAGEGMKEGDCMLPFQSHYPPSSLSRKRHKSDEEMSLPPAYY